MRRPLILSFVSFTIGSLQNYPVSASTHENKRDTKKKKREIEKHNSRSKHDSYGIDISIVHQYVTDIGGEKLLCDFVYLQRHVFDDTMPR
jgi:hypothetical protein